ncbi:retinoschisin-like [Patiria miniata]|uniref:F5/8 type C domain-containing protein n=1 Tax=Patiria miniata TaxID=46514 RepID=A0A914A6V3_PATMI|nr:retinoschisin-like [Patiria miniata]
MDGAVAWAVMVSALTVIVSCHKVCFIGSEYNPQSGIPPRWFLPYKDPCECTAIRLGGTRISASSYRKWAPFYLDELFLSEDSYEIQTYFSCSRATKVPIGRPKTYSLECSSPEPLGLEDGTITDDRMTASDHNQNWPASKGRLNYNGGWAARSLIDPWIEVDLIEASLIAGVITQGDGDWYVTQYKVAYKNQPSSHFEHVTDGSGNITIFIGNTDGNTPVTNLFYESAVATVMRIEPTKWSTGVGLRLELLGCNRD